MTEEEIIEFIDKWYKTRERTMQIVLMRDLGYLAELNLKVFFNDIKCDIVGEIKRRKIESGADVAE